MSSRIGNSIRSGADLEIVSARRERFKDAYRATLRWLRDAFGLLATATLLAWVVVRFTR
jgi:hypothetical protein